METLKEDWESLSAKKKKKPQQMTASHWSGPSCEGAYLVDLHETGCNVALWSAKLFVSHYTTLALVDVMNA